MRLVQRTLGECSLGLQSNYITSQRRKAQNRAAQRAFRIRQRQAVTEVTAKMRAMQEELKEAISMKENFERLYENLTTEHERLLSKFEEASSGLNFCEGITVC